MQTLATLLANKTQHCWAQHVASVCTPCCVLLRVVVTCWKLLDEVWPVSNFIQQLPTTSNNVASFCTGLNKTIIPFALVGYEIGLPSHIPTRVHGLIVKYTIMAKPIKSLELHYPVMQFLIIKNILDCISAKRLELLQQNLQHSFDRGLKIRTRTKIWLIMILARNPKPIIV